MKEERDPTHGSVDREVPDVVPCRDWKVPGERGVQQAIQHGRSEHEHPEDPTEDREIEIAAAREGTTLVVAQPALRLPPRESPRRSADGHERDLRGRLALAMRFDAHDPAAERC